MTEDKEDKNKFVEKLAKTEEAEEIVEMVNRGIEFTKELLQENERLRFKIFQTQQENQELLRESKRGGLSDKLREELRRLEDEKNKLLAEYAKVEQQNQEYAMRYVEVESENNNLANLYVCSYQLHSTLDFHEVLQIIMEIIINLIGAEEFGVFLLDEKSRLLRPVAMEGRELESMPNIPIGEGAVGKSAETGANYYAADIENTQRNREPNEPLVCIPLKIKEQVIGIIVLYKLLPQKTQFANVDYELFTLLAGHAATAIFSSRLYTEAQRKLSTIQGFMELLTH
jgi:transcriptional regulator with GAF, ATPase, and Fis domain